MVTGMKAHRELSSPQKNHSLICRLGSFADATVKRKIGPLARAPSLALQILRRMRRQKDIFAFVRRDDDGVCGSVGSVGAKKVGRR